MKMYAEFTVTRAVIVILLLAFLPAPVLAKAFPAGKCTTQDDGMIEATPPAPRPAIIVLPDVPPPNTGDPDKPFIADLVLDVRGDGAVAKARVACTNVSDKRYTSALLAKAKDWRIGAGKPKRYAYRVVISPSGPKITPAPLAAR